MPTHFDGFTEDEIDQGYEAFFSARDCDELGHAIDDLPVLRAPIFHALLRNYFQKHYQQDDPRSNILEERYYAFFEVLHNRIYNQLVQNRFGASLEGSIQPERKPSFYAPPFMQFTLDLVEGIVPASGPTYILPNDQGRLTDEVSRLIGKRASLLPHRPRPGSRWSMLVLRCPACGEYRLEVRAFVVNLVTEPALLEPLREGLINNSRCNACSGELVEPLRVWAVEEPTPDNDALSLLSCAYVFGPSLLIYQPPPGTVRDKTVDRVLEVRFQQLLRDSGVNDWLRAQPGQEGPRMMVFGVAYNLKELVSYSQQQDDSEDFPLDMRTFVSDQAEKVRSGFAPLGATLKAVREVASAVGHDWPVVVPSLPEHGGARDPYEVVIVAVIAEECARLKGLPIPARVLLAGVTAQALRTISENGMAEAAVAAARDLLDEVDDSDPMKRKVEMALRLGEAEQVQALGEAEQSLLLRSGFLQDSSELIDESKYELSIFQEREAQASLNHMTGKIAESVAGYAECLPRLEKMTSEVQSTAEANPDDGEAVARSIAAQHALSGSMANWATVVMHLADHIDGLSVVCTGSTRMASGGNPRIRDSRHDAELRESLDEAVREYERRFKGPMSSAALRDIGCKLFERALSISIAVEGWRFAAIQAGHLSYIHGRAGRILESKRYAEKMMEYAARVGGHEQLAVAHHCLGDIAIDEKDGGKALEHYRSAARECVHLAVSSGQHIGNYIGQAEQFAIGAMMASEFGAEPIEVFLVTETVKALPTAIAIGRRGLDGDQVVVNKDRAELVALRERREELRLSAVWDRGNLRAIQSDIDAVELEIEHLTRSLTVRDPGYLLQCDAAGLEFPRPGEFLRRLDALGSATVFLGIYPEARGLWSYMIGADGCTYRLTPWPLNADGKPMFDQLSRSQWAEMILSPHQDRLRSRAPTDRLVFSTHDAFPRLSLSSLPFDSEPLCRRISISYIQSGEVFTAVLRSSRSKFKTIACFGNPDRSDCGSLPHAEDEAAEIVTLFQRHNLDAEIFVRDRASVTALKQIAVQSDVLHFACHAGGDLSGSNLSRLLLAPDPMNRDSGDLTDGRVLTEIRFKPGCFVNLAGCRTGGMHDNRRALPRGLVGAFLYAGAVAVMGSLWPVADHEARLFQNEFYRHVLSGSGLVASLAATQRACLDGNLGVMMEHPGAWAAYVIYGEG
ncbi:MAG: CHAT domain-containing protein [Zavarzinella sp.]